MNHQPHSLDADRTLWNARWTGLAAMGLVLCGSSCSSVSQYVQNTFHKSHPPVASSEEDSAADPHVKHAFTATDKNHQNVETLKHTETAIASAAAANATGQALQENASKAPNTPAATSSDSDNVLALVQKGSDPFGASTGNSIKDPAVQQASNEQTSLPDNPFNGNTKPSSATIQHANEPRKPLTAQLTSASEAFAPANSCPPVIGGPKTESCPPAAPCNSRPFPGPEVAGDEYICDGGDKGEPVHYEGRNRAGLNTEDTIAEFKDEEGRAHVQPSTETCVYAPRFASVSTATLPQEERDVDHALGHQDKTAVAGLETKTVIDEKVQTDEAKGVLMRSRASEVEKNQAEDHIEQATAAENHVKLVNVSEDFRFLQEGQFDLVDSAILTHGVGAAHEWADGRRPVIVAKDAGGQLVQGRFTAQDYTGVEDRRSPGELKLVKVADRASAHPGDIITFTIRFDNVGGRDLFDVRLIDNLSPRLEFIEDSITSDRDGQITTANNGVGGKLLTFEFDQPLKGKTGGYITFQCKVR